MHGDRANCHRKALLPQLRPQHSHRPPQLPVQPQQQQQVVIKPSATADGFARRVPGPRTEDAASREVDVVLPAPAALGADFGTDAGTDSGGAPARQRRYCARFDCRRCCLGPSGDCQKPCELVDFRDKGKGKGMNKSL